MDQLITAVRSVHFGTADLEASAAFYERVWGLVPIADDDGTRFFRASGSDAYVVALERRAPGELLRVGLTARDAAAVDVVFDRLAAAGGTALSRPSRAGGPAGGYGFSFLDPEGRDYDLRSDMRAPAASASANDRPVKISHVVLNAANADAVTAFFTTLLGFRVRDRTRMMDFLGCNRDHHSIAVTRVGNTSLNHVAFELPDIDGVMRGSGRLKQSGYPIEWGVGRHGPGDNVFAYFIDPSGIPIEYTAEVDQIDDAVHVVGTPQTWSRGSNLDAWGLADPPSRRFDIATHFADALKVNG